LTSLGHPIQFQPVSRLGYLTAPTSLNGGQQNFAGCLAVSWAGTLYIHFWRLLPPNGILPAAKVTLRLSLAFSYIGSTALQQRASARLCGVMVLQNFCRGCHLYSAGRPSRWASAHILVIIIISGLLNVRGQNDMSEDSIYDGKNCRGSVTAAVGFTTLDYVAIFHSH